MPDFNNISSAHESFPFSAPALQSASITPDYPYLDIYYARQLNSLLNSPKPSFSPGEFAAIGLMGKASLSIIRQFLKASPNSFSDLDASLLNEFDLDTVQHAILEALDRFPTLLSFSDPTAKTSYLLGDPGSTPFRHSYYCSLLLILIAENNPAIKSNDGLFTDPVLRSSLQFQDLLAAIQEYFANQAIPGYGGSTLIDFLLEPSRLFPSSIFDQLFFIRSRWEDLLDDSLLRSLLLALDQIKEETLGFIPGQNQPEDPLGYLSSTEIIDSELINFSSDLDWMPQVVLQAKNIFVWLDQLSRQYQMPITRLDQIPDDELIKLSSRGLNALWLIGLWERSPASQKIKQICGNPEAVSSAYSLYDYSIAESLGGENAYQLLSSRASVYNIRLAADMVPNHMGIYSRWVIDHPDWFLSLDHPPFPGYTFEGADLSSDPSVSIFLEDHYYDKSDASVVFKRVDNSDGGSRFIYHGNDGTSMPWNDTAQLDFLNPEVREAVIQIVLSVARKFPIIRFDAAMTLSKKHYQRLWFPEPGTGGAIPTRSNFSLTKDQFDSQMPKEFWRELVDRVAQEAPNTLLLAEAFWMMEGYFVRSLGMHRVYNSAFMHMLRDEDNTKFRALIINTLEYDPQILKRYVNFMNNPDEDTALSQFGSGGKYFGTCLLMSTLPGLPMFGHGQIEGLSEKYGMEYKKAYYDESPDLAFIERHQREIFPFLHNRRLFSEVDHFNLYDLTLHDGSTNNDVLIYSNRLGAERALIVFHNKWGDTRGRIINSTPINGQSVSFLKGLGVSITDGDYLIFQDQITKLEYIRSIPDLASNGLYLEIGAYAYHAFINFKAVWDTDGSYSELEKNLLGKGVFDLEKHRLEIKYSPLLVPISSFLSSWESDISPAGIYPIKLTPKLQDHIRQIATVSGQSFFDLCTDLLPSDNSNSSSPLNSFLNRISSLTSLLSSPLSKTLSSDPFLLIPWAFFAGISLFLGKDDLDIILSQLIDSHTYYKNLASSDFDSLQRRLSVMIYLAPLLEDAVIDLANLADLWFSNQILREFINVHEFEGETWFHKESMEYLIDITIILLYFHLSENRPPDFSLTPEDESSLISLRDVFLQALYESDFRIEKFLQVLSAHSSST